MTPAEMVSIIEEWSPSWLSQDTIDGWKGGDKPCEQILHDLLEEAECVFQEAMA